VSTYKSFCRYCVAGCGIIVDCDHDDVISVRGDSEDPLSGGYTCVKGRMMGIDHHHPGRLTNAWLGKLPDRGPSTTQEVVDDLGVRLRALLDRFGPDSIGVFRGNSMAGDSAGRPALFSLFAKIGSRSVYTAKSIDSVPKVVVSSLMTGTGYSKLNQVIDETSKLVLIFGSNPVVSHGHNWSFPNPVVRLRKLKDLGELWVIDPRRTETARLASRHLAPRPGTDYAILAYAVREILRGGADWDYVHAHTADVEVLRDAVEPFTVSMAGSKCGLPEQDLLDLVAAIRQAGRFAGVTGTGLTMSKAPCMAEWLLWCLLAITGSFEAAGGTWFNPDFFEQNDLKQHKSTFLGPAAGPPSRPDLPSWGGERPCAALADEIFASNVRALIVVGGNPAVAFPDASRILQALQTLEVLAVAEIAQTATTDLATHLIPVTDQLERADYNATNFLGSAVFGRYTPRIINPVGDRWPVWRVMEALGRHLGVEVLPSGLHSDTCTEEDVVASLATNGRVPFSDLLKTGSGVIAAEPIVRGWVQERVLDDGRWRLAPDLFVSQLSVLADSLVEGTVFIPYRQSRHINSKLVDVMTRDGKHDRPLLLMHPEDCQAANIREGELAEIKSNNGRLVGEVKLDTGALKGTVSIPNGFTDTNVNLLTSSLNDVDPVSGMPIFSGVPVEIRSLEHPAEL
jgi:anaerobic selenocysteine-containing dehydrogenase